LPGSSASKKPLNIPVDPFLASLRFENREVLDDLVPKIDPKTLKSGD
jgi:hypothetical protein